MFRVIDNVEEAWALHDAGLLWWDCREPADKEWSNRVHRTAFEESVSAGMFSILLEE